MVFRWMGLYLGLLRLKGTFASFDLYLVLKPVCLFLFHVAYEEAFWKKKMCWKLEFSTCESLTFSVAKCHVWASSSSERMHEQPSDQNKDKRIAGCAANSVTMRSSLCQAANGSITSDFKHWKADQLTITDLVSSKKWATLTNCNWTDTKKTTTTRFSPDWLCHWCWPQARRLEVKVSPLINRKPQSGTDQSDLSTWFWQMFCTTREPSVASPSMNSAEAL